MTYWRNNSTCHLFYFMSANVSWGVCDDVSGIRSSMAPKPCSCDRVFKSVGREYLPTVMGDTDYDRAGGNW